LALYINTRTKFVHDHEVVIGFKTEVLSDGSEGDWESVSRQSVVVLDNQITLVVSV
jgi:hypothetical protein